MTAHVHAHLMALYAQDAAETDRPWDLWEYRYDGFDWSALSLNPKWDARAEYRRKPATIKIGDMEVPKPISKAPSRGMIYFVPKVSAGHDLYSEVRWDGNSIDERFLRQRLVHFTKEAALQHAKALIAVSGGQV